MRSIQKQEGIKKKVQRNMFKNKTPGVTFPPETDLNTAPSDKTDFETCRSIQKTTPDMGLVSQVCNCNEGKHKGMRQEKIVS